MEKLSFQDATFLRMESPQRPFHVAGLMIFRPPDSAPATYLRALARRCGRLNELWPLFNKKLQEPQSLSNPAWVKADDYDPANHVWHYALPSPGRMDDLLKIVTKVHERMLDRSHPLWELHLIENLNGGRFALYCKVHHALIDGVGALRMIDTLFSTSPLAKIDFRAAKPIAVDHQKQVSLMRQLNEAGHELKKHYEALPQVSGMLRNMGRDALRGDKDAPPLPFTAPRTLFNTEVDASRQIILAELPLKRIRALAAPYGGTVNDALIAICGGALREYLIEHDALPGTSLEAGVPVSIKRSGDEQGNQVAFIICPFFTQERDPLKRLQKVIRVSGEAKRRIREMSATAAQDFTNALMMPTLLLTLAGNSSRMPPALNAIVSNIPGSHEALYLDGARLERLYPLSVVTDGMALNITVVSYLGKLNIAITSCPTEQPGIGELGRLVRKHYQQLAAAAQP
jgi:diacylglycerol O-acyltransferase